MKCPQNLIFWHYFPRGMHPLPLPTHPLDEDSPHRVARLTVAPPTFQLSATYGKYTLLLILIGRVHLNKSNSNMQHTIIYFNHMNINQQTHTQTHLSKMLKAVALCNNERQC